MMQTQITMTQTSTVPGPSPAFNADKLGAPASKFLRDDSSVASKALGALGKEPPALSGKRASVPARAFSWAPSCADIGTGPAITFSEIPTNPKQSADTKTMIFFIVSSFTQIKIFFFARP